MKPPLQAALEKSERQQTIKLCIENVLLPQTTVIFAPSFVTYRLKTPVSVDLGALQGRTYCLNASTSSLRAWSTLGATGAIGLLRVDIELRQVYEA